MPYRSGLRERKKHETRAALASAALSIAQTEGLRAATPERIAEDAGVSARTFHNYFANRDAAVIHDYVEGAEHFIDIFQHRQEREPVWTALCEAFIQVVEDRGVTDDQMRRKEQLIRSYPELLSSLAAQYDSLRDRLSAAIADATGFDSRSAETTLVAGSAIVAFRAGQERWYAQPESRLPDQVRRSFAMLEHGLIASVGDTATVSESD
ncbi:TetR family transcriptional regulator [Haloglycomyces albus]|uniref:acyl-CoA-like ligand-binding transcription factor n=1 Tax=Haloglycomyces albus TaxID=526067 RepID=UPI00046D509E|nr:TetR family transcriptional regulator [Haloglycomyces albus]